MSGLRQAALVIGACVPLLSASAQTQPEHAGHSIGEHFGSVHFPISCSPDAQRQFDRAVAMLHSFFYPETVKAFSAIAQAEPSCAMAYWGVAISQRPNPLVPPFPPALLQAGWEAIEKARAANPPTQRERDWIEALGVFFESYDTLDQKTRTAKYEAAMAKLHERYPQDTEAAVFYALALNEAVDLTDKSYSRQLKAAAILEPLARALPDHPGIVHLIIHSYDYAPIAAKGLPAARRYADARTLCTACVAHAVAHLFDVGHVAGRDPLRPRIRCVRQERMHSPRHRNSAAKPAANPARYHSLDFLTNAYLQLAQDKRALAIVEQRNSVAELSPRASAIRRIPRLPQFRCAMPSSAARGPKRRSCRRRARPIRKLKPSPGSGARSARHGPRDLDGARRDVDEIVRLRAQLAAAQDVLLDGTARHPGRGGEGVDCIGRATRGQRDCLDALSSRSRRSYRKARRHGEQALADARVAGRAAAGGRQTRGGAARIRAFAQVRAEPISLVGRRRSGRRPGGPQSAGSRVLPTATRARTGCRGRSCTAQGREGVPVKTLSTIAVRR